MNSFKLILPLNSTSIKTFISEAPICIPDEVLLWLLYRFSLHSYILCLPFSSGISRNGFWTVHVRWANRQFLDSIFCRTPLLIKRLRLVCSLLLLSLQDMLLALLLVIYLVAQFFFMTWSASLIHLSWKPRIILSLQVVPVSSIVYRLPHVWNSSNLKGWHHCIP